MNEVRLLYPGIVEVSSKKNGPRFGIICNIHGNETCGRNAIQSIISSCKLQMGSLVIIDGNQEAALINRRYVHSDMNRMFSEPCLSKEFPSGDLVRAQYLAQKIPSLNLDSAIDIHSTSNGTAHPFTISFPGSEELTELCPFPKIYGWNGIITGTFVEWMNLSGIPTVGIEAGQHSDPESTLVAEHTLKILMIEQGLLTPQNLLSEKLHIKIYPEHTYKVVENVIVEDGESFEFQRPLKGFDALRPNEIIARDSNKIYYAPSEQGYHVLMPAVIGNIKSGISKSAYYLMLKI